MADGKIGVLFVCLGNICRSPVAEGVFRHLLIARGVEHVFEVDSAGVSGYHAGDSPDSRSVSIARGRGVTIAGTSRQIRRQDLIRFDYVIVMDAENLSSVRRLAAEVEGTAEVRLLRDWDPENPGGDVPDPYYGGPRGFEEVHDIVERSCVSLLEHILSRTDAR